MYRTHWWERIGCILVLTMIAWGLPTIADAQGWDMPMMRGGWGIVMMLMMVIFWAVVILALVFFIRWLISASGPKPTERGPDTDSALQILQKRYARGEISKQDYEDMRRDLQG